MKIQLITPASMTARNGNSITAFRWRRILQQLGHRVFLNQSYNGAACDLLIALHARRSAPSIQRFHKRHPDLPLIVALTGTDLYRDIRSRQNAQRSLELATRLIVLQSMGKAELPRRFRAKTRVIYQSAPRIKSRAPLSKNGFKVCVIGHLRPEKDPMRTAIAARLLPPSSQLRVVHVGRALSRKMKVRVRAQIANNPRYRWLGELPHWKTRQLLAGSHLLSLTSQMEGSSNVLCEAVASSVPVVAARIPGLMGTLGKDYPGYFPVGDARKLSVLLHKAESDPGFYRELKIRCHRLRSLVAPKRELEAWRQLLGELL